VGVCPTTTTEVMLYAHYLIVEKKAKVTDSYALIRKDKIIREEYPVGILRDWMPRLGTEEYKLKMEIVQEFANQGVDYWSTPIPEWTLQNIKKRYPDTWEEYIKVY